ncbi:MAG: sigma-70 family RNA polymerase sigma factor [Myxococcota bacterium]
MLAPDAREALDRTIRSLCDEGRHDEATSKTLRAYGPELMGFLIATAKDDAAADDAFGSACEHIWKGLPRFEWRSSLRTWLYAVTRNALRMVQRGAARKREVPLSAAAPQDLVAEVRTRTRTFLRTETKDAVAELRRQLDPEDQQLLLLRVGRKMSWIDIAQVMNEDTPLDEDALKRAAARLRQRFSRAKAQLEKLVLVHGLKDG